LKEESEKLPWPTELADVTMGLLDHEFLSRKSLNLDVLQNSSEKVLQKPGHL
jgi:hypothetical protein